MYLIQEPQLSDFSECSYFPEKRWRFEYFFGAGLSEEELNELLENGWRKFGFYYFRPDCVECFECAPIRVLTEKFKPSKSQRRVLRKNQMIEVKYGPLVYKNRIYEIYRDHSIKRFNKESDEESFYTSFYTLSCPSMQSEYYLEDKLIGVGFLDRSNVSLSSVYFVFDTEYTDLNLGTFSILKEIEHARELELKYYYLGYYIKDNQSMSYKNRFHPNEKFNWSSKEWFLDE